MIEWSDALIKELAARRCIIFLGSGASAGCEPSYGGEKPPTWGLLLETLCGKIKNNLADKAFAEALIKEGKYLDAAEIICERLNEADYFDAMRSIFSTPRFKPSEIHKSVLRIDPKIVITTNFDTVYDQYCREGEATAGYNIFKYTDNHLVEDLRSPMRCIIKAHGCITDPGSMVLTKSGFFKARQDAPHFFKILDALFLTHTILFIGYSITDPDIQIALENSNISAPSSRRHYFVTGSGTHSAIKSSIERTYNLNFVEFETGNYEQLNNSLAELADRVLEQRLANPDF